MSVSSKKSKLMSFHKLIALRINAKCGGVNIVPARPNPNIMLMDQQFHTMIIGIDTSHPPPGSTHPTMAAMVYSIDRYGVDYRASISIQEARMEPVRDLKNMFMVSLFPSLRGFARAALNDILSERRSRVHAHGQRTPCTVHRLSVYPFIQIPFTA